MSEQETEQTDTTSEQAAPEVDAQTAPKTYDAAYVEKLRKEAARYRTEAKTGEEARLRLKEIEDRDLSELEKARRDAEQATSRLAEYEKTTVRQRVALEKGLPASLVGRLQGATEDEISADADALLALIKTPTSPRPDPSQGARTASAEDMAAAEYEKFYPSTRQ